VLKKELPEGWEWKYLCDVISYRKGKKPKKMYDEFQDLAYLTTHTLRSGKSTQYISDMEVDDCVISDCNNLLIIWDGSNSGEIFLGRKGVVASTMAKIEIIHENVSRKYLYYLLKSRFDIFNGKTTGSSIPHLNKNLFEKQRIPFPCIETQHKIVAILEKVEATQRLRAEADALTQELVQSVFLEMFGDPVTNPMGWDVKKLGDLAIIKDVDHKMPKEINNGIMYISTKDFCNHDKINFENTKKISEDDYIRLSRKIKPEYGDIIYSRYGTIGEVRLVPKDIKFQISYSLCIIRLQNEDINYLYLYYILKNSKFRKYAINKKRSSSIPDLGLGEIKQLKIIMPPLDLQQQFVNYAKIIEASQQKQIESSNNIKNQFEALNSLLFKGKLIV